MDSKVFFNYSFDKQRSKVLYSHSKRRIPNSFSGTIFNRHRSMLESGELESDMSHLYFFISAVTDCCETVNQYMNNVSLTPIDINLICSGGVNMTPPPSQFFCDNFFSKNAIKLKFSDFNFTPFRHILTKFNVMYPSGSKILVILLEGGKKNYIYTKFTIFLIFTCMCIY